MPSCRGAATNPSPAAAFLNREKKHAKHSANPKTLGNQPGRRKTALDDRSAVGTASRGHSRRTAQKLQSWCGLDMAVSVAAGVPCLRQFEVKTPGPVIFFPAEDGGPTARDRIEGIARAGRNKLQRPRNRNHHRTYPSARLTATLRPARQYRPSLPTPPPRPRPPRTPPPRR